MFSLASDAIVLREIIELLVVLLLLFNDFLGIFVHLLFAFSSSLLLLALFISSLSPGLFLELSSLGSCLVVSLLVLAHNIVCVALELFLVASLLLSSTQFLLLFAPGKLLLVLLQIV